MAEDAVSDTVYRSALGRELIAAALRLVAAAPSPDRFPQDAAALEELVTRAGRVDDDTGIAIELESGSTLPRYQGIGRLWVGPAGDGSVRLRAEYARLRAIAAQLWPDGRLSEFALEEGFGVPDEELTEQARADVEAVDRDLRERVELDAEHERTRFRGRKLLRVLSAPWQDPARFVVSSVELYKDGLIVSYVLPRPAGVPTEDPEDELFSAALPPVEVRDDTGTTYGRADVDVDDVNGPVLRANQTFMPAVPEHARFLVVKGPAGSVEISLEGESR